MASKKKMMIITFVSVAVLLAAGSAFLLIRGISTFRQTSLKQKNDIQQLGQFYDADPFPSQANVSKIALQVSVANDWFRKLAQAVSEGQISLDSTQKSPSRFMSIFASTRQELMEFAAKNGVSMPQNFTFGFNAYATGIPPNPDDVARLTQQLLILKEICNVMIEQRVDGISGLRREVFEQTTAGSMLSGMAMGPGPGPAGAGQSGGIVNANAGIIAEGAFYGKWRYVLEFQAKETALVGLINKLVNHDLFIVVKSVRIAKKGSDVKDKSSGIGPVYGGPGALMMPRDSQPEDNPEGEELASGFSVEVPMDVMIELDVCVFRELDTGSESK